MQTDIYTTKGNLIAFHCALLLISISTKYSPYVLIHISINSPNVAEWQSREGGDVHEPLSFVPGAGDCGHERLQSTARPVQTV